MRTPEENIQLANMLFPEVKETPEDIEKKYPKRELKKGEMVLRFAPSPTGFLHIGSVFVSLIDRILTNQKGGTFILRIEDTDKTREVEGGINMIVKGLEGFGISFDEGMTGDDKSKGEYGPYLQSKRLDIYKVYAKDMIVNGNAYPCFITEEELGEIRKKQEEMGVRTGYYGNWAKWRNASLEEIQQKLNNGEKFAIRLYSTGNMENSFKMQDLIKGNVTLRENDVDTILLKSDGYPTYHFAHPIDDTLMGITLVTRADEWFASLPLHVELFKKLGFELPQYCHFSPLQKLDNEGKSRRKLSKRKDPEADVQYYIDHGYPKEGVKEYLLNVANSNFYDWKVQNPGKISTGFVLKLEKFNKSGALFDIVKLDDMCKDYIATLTAQQVYDMALEWAEVYNKNIAELLKNNREYCINIFNIEREGNKIRKDLVKFEDISTQLDIFFDELLEKEPVDDISEKVSKEKQVEILKEYIQVYDTNDDQTQWFEKVKVLASKLGYEKVGDVAMVIRVALTHRTKSPDLYQVMKVMGKEKVMQRLEKYIG
ncbi:MAG: glutamyl-tRNA ligase [candidate division WS6 bacterium GW2011_GWC1_36_11]|uniref:Glutamate--tRNA ligase n=2 Tax=Candidatus Dojkabacteria TaxID=74243 RepID=A0A0G0GLN3_9BACT|nr:MAG: glutamyl-tRNA ligase [candidate division WS6 bacterium GW2011_GWC1_36_11]KKQ11978.1 MAG: glutamyl-tRNA ligase [candidate division WS6 bacterium GW2011_GWC2_36_7]HAM37731.1 glutamate--tRNA ligase [Patescibacteria group bacterium]